MGTPIYDRLVSEKSIRAAEEEFFEYANSFPNEPFEVKPEELKKFARSMVHNLYMVLSRSQEKVVKSFGAGNQETFNIGYTSAINSLVNIYSNAEEHNG